MGFKVQVTAEWLTQHEFDFDSEVAAQSFKEAVNGGDLEAIVAAGDIDASTAELVNFEAGKVRINE